MRVSVVHIPTSVDGAKRNWSSSQGGRRHTSASGGTRCDRAYKGRQGTPGSSPSRPPLVVARLRSRLVNDVRSLMPPLTPPLPSPPLPSLPLPPRRAAPHRTAPHRIVLQRIAPHRTASHRRRCRYVALPSSHTALYCSVLTVT